VILPLDKPGRYSEGTTLEIGCGIVDFETSRFKGGMKVVVAGEDGAVRVFGGDTGGEVLGKMQVEKVVQVSWHGLASGVIGVLCVDQGDPEFRLWNIESGEMKRCRLAYAVGYL